ncbi:MAG: excinuclease ABC subunit UvrC, partial [Coxiellaceae bacterium]|nr:excinuclease ABC subunit UvrC [Coxiellaceae bacterium]
IQVIFIRGGRMLGNRSFFPKTPDMYQLQEIMSAFITQFYLNQIHSDDLPERIIVNVDVDEQEWIENALSERLSKTVSISSSVRGKNRQWLTMAATNAIHALASHNALKQGYYDRMQALQNALRLGSLPQRIECFDISHSQGEATVGSCVVYTLEGPKPSDYRRFNVKEVTPGDDYGALEHVIRRRYVKLKQDDHILPDIVMIDGGKGQLGVAEKVLEECQVSGVTLLSIAKGPGRKPDFDRIFISGRSAPIDLKADSPALHMLQHIRDEAHRFAITAHRTQRGKKKVSSEVAEIPGIGPKKRRDLLRHFGGLRELKRASVQDIAKVPGIGEKTAKIIYDALH